MCWYFDWVSQGVVSVSDGKVQITTLILSVKRALSSLWPQWKETHCKVGTQRLRQRTAMRKVDELNLLITPPSHDSSRPILYHLSAFPCLVAIPKWWKYNCNQPGAPQICYRSKHWSSVVVVTHFLIKTIKCSTRSHKIAQTLYDAIRRNTLRELSVAGN